MRRALRLASLAFALFLSVSGVRAVEPGWHYSPLPGEGDRASLGCDSKATASAFTCLAVRCEDDLTTGLYVHASDPPASPALWTLTIDRENLALRTEPAAGPYAARVVGDIAPILERLEQGTFVYLRRDDDDSDAFVFIDLAGSLTSIREALYWCAPKAPVSEQNTLSRVTPQTEMENSNEPTSPGPQ